MKKLILGLSLCFVGCAYNSNQKTCSPLLGSVHNEYYIITVNVSSEDDLNNVLTNITKRCSTKSDSKCSKTSRILLGRGSEIFAIDNQVLIGHDFGNNTSNAVDGTLSIPISN